MKKLLIASTALLFSFMTAQAEVAEGLTELFPDGLIDSKGEAVELDSLDGKGVIGIYFSAHWCPPCKIFTPKLVKYRNDNAKDFQMVFVSSDKSPKAQLGYMTETKMDCPTLTHRSDAANALSEKYGVKGIPMLVLVDSKGELISREGRKFVSEGVEASKLASAKIVTEEYNCGKCSKVHTREKLVFADAETKK